MSAPPKLTEAAWQRLEQVADQKLGIPGYKKLAHELGIAETYLKNLMSQVVRRKRRGLPVPHETRRKSQLNKEQLDELAIEHSKA